MEVIWRKSKQQSACAAAMYTVANLDHFNNNSVRPGTSTSTNNNKVVDSNYNKLYTSNGAHKNLIGNSNQWFSAP
jgi:hypothetical protein